MAKKVKSKEPELLPTTEPVVNPKLETLKQLLADVDLATVTEYKQFIEQSLEQRQNQPVYDLLTAYKGLVAQQQALFKQLIEEPTKKTKKVQAKNPLRMYKDYSYDGQSYKIAPLINLESRLIFTGGNPEKTSWLANLNKEQRIAQYGALRLLEQDPDLLETLMSIPKAVYKEEGKDNWVPCYQPE